MMALPMALGIGVKFAADKLSAKASYVSSTRNFQILKSVVVKYAV